MKKIVLGIVAICLLFSLIACTKEESEKGYDTVIIGGAKEENSEEVGEEIVPLKDDKGLSEMEITNTLSQLYEFEFDETVRDIEIDEVKVYSSEDEQNNPAIKDLHLSKDEVAFEVIFRLEPYSEKDIDELTIPNGEYNEESGWIENCHRVGILRPNDGEGINKYKITDLGTGW